MKKASPAVAKRRIKFKNPPIQELGIGFFHLPILELKAQHIGLYWNRIRDKYPLCEQQPPIATISDVQQTILFQDAPPEIFPLPRFWFSSSEHPNLIQVQRNAFMLNWRRVTPNEYPHYETVAEAFWQELGRYKTFIHESVRGKLEIIQRCELSYVNLVTPNEMFASEAQLANVLPPIASLYDLHSDDRQLTGLNTTATYQVNPTLLIDLAIRLGRRPETKELAAVLELKASGGPPDLSLDAARQWFDAAHDATYKLFLDATDKEVQKTIWKPR